MAASANDKVKCDGGGGALGHPAVYLTFGNKSEISCPYCGKLFQKPVKQAA